MADFTDLTFLHLFLENDLVARGDIGNVMQGLFVILAPGVGMIGVILIVEGHARADDVEHRNAIMCHGGFEQFLDLLGITGKGTRHEGRIQMQALPYRCPRAYIDWRPAFLSFSPFSAVAEN